MVHLVDDAIKFAKAKGGGVRLAMDALAVNLGEKIVPLIPSY